MYDFFCDESSQNGHHFMVLGGAVVRTAREPEISDSLRDIKARHHISGKVRWTDLSRHKLPAYVEFFEAFHRFMGLQQACFHSLVVDATQIDNRTYNAGDREVGFSKFIYQLLLHKFAKKYAPPPLNAYLDTRTTDQSLEDVRDMINSALARDHNIDSRPLRRLQFQSPLERPLLEAADLIIGATAFHQNGRHEMAGASAHKIALAEHIAYRLGQRLLGSPTQFDARDYTVWTFRFPPNRRSQGPR